MRQSQAVAWAAAPPQADSPLASQLIFALSQPVPPESHFGGTPSIVARPASDFAGLTAGFDAAAERLTKVAAAGDLPPACAVADLHAAPRGPYIAVTLACGESVATGLIHAGTGAFRLLDAGLGAESIFLGWSPNGLEVLLRVNVTSDPRLYHVRAADGQATRLNVPPDTRSVAISPDGSWMVYTRSRGLGFGSETWRAELDGGSARLIINDPTSMVTYARYSPAGERIAYIRMMDSNIPFTVGELWWINNDGSHKVLLADADAGHGYEPAWSPDGRWIAFVFRENGGNVGADQAANRLHSNLYMADLTSGALTAVTQFPSGYVETPSWSPDGRTLAFAASLDGKFDVWAYDVPSQSLVRVTEGANARHPTWLYGQ